MEDQPAFERGLRPLCFTCGGFRQISEPRLYVIQATHDLQTGMTLGEWRTCRQCAGNGQLSELLPPV